MGIAALITWLITAVGGFLMLGMWISGGGLRRRTTHLPAPLIFAHFLLAAAGLIIWIIYLIVDVDALSWVAFIVLLPVAVLGFVMLFRWLSSRQGDATAPDAPAERKFPIPVVIGHGLFAVITLVLVLLVALSES
jgi:manganese efflux pump family protein